MGLGDEGLVLILALIDFLSPFFFFPFPSVAKRGDGSGGSYEKVSL